jgi:hypothetical protein
MPKPMYLLTLMAVMPVSKHLLMPAITKTSVSLFEKTPLYEPLANISKSDEIKEKYNQLNMFEL